MAQRHHPPSARREGPAFFRAFAAVPYTLELTLDKKKFLFVSRDGLIANIAWQVVDAARRGAFRFASGCCGKRRKTPHPVRNRHVTGFLGQCDRSLEDR